MTDDICRCLPPDSARHKVNDPKVYYSGDLSEGKIGREPSLLVYAGHRPT